jgi:O-6-methylguanine DNA methyltransferase
MRCRTALTRIDAARTDELSKNEAGSVNEHLRTCKSCHKSLDDVSDLAQNLKALGSAPSRSCRDDVTSTVCDRFDVVHAGDQSAWVAFTNDGVRMIHRGTERDFRRLHRERFDRGLTAGSLSEKLKRQIAAALTGEETARADVDLSSLTAFERDVLRILATIPRGEVRTYAWLARQAGRPTATRAVGNIMARNPIPFLLPCHRVVPTSGGIGNYAYGSPIKRAILRREGVPVDQLEALGREGVRFIGSKTTHIFCFPTCRDAKRIRAENRVPFRHEDDALDEGYRPCERCKPAA